MKSLLIVLTICATIFATALPSSAATASSAEAAWAPYFGSLKTAVAKHDKATLKALIASRIDYEDGTVSAARFIEDFGSEGERLSKALKTGSVSGSGPKRLLQSEVAEIEFIFAKGKWYLKSYNVGG
ncbi:MAG TPA: hypothetical protein VM940_15180 [Chthoniobacterales bacterium]|jgi:hypothetical protein|nr:hypothetical protein [Chthoniobacterales bacterium]